MILTQIEASDCCNCLVWNGVSNFGSGLKYGGKNSVFWYKRRQSYKKHTAGPYLIFRGVTVLVHAWSL